MLQFALLPLQAGGEAAGLDQTTVLIATVVGFIIGLVIAAGAGYWVYRDAAKRENNELAWGLGVGGLLLVAFPVGVVALIAYVIIRGDKTATEPVQEGPAGEW
ncbi:hypothetical protein [Natrinema salaciae]|uniref:Phospholipase_D-nuclease N-terminal n=1 Tax=Natrinema salaciae TaxID=1186196 RepID=A0A1H9IWL2_9EURY|nr:hypothetical protein [Natrinema salaciae]SEQ78964.1 hypothetical protein SAMN04489841_2357 [Natrinema salaciae]